MKTKDYVYIITICFCFAAILTLYTQKKEVEEQLQDVTKDNQYLSNSWYNDMILLQEFQEAMRIVIIKYPESAEDFSSVMESINTHGTTEIE